MKDAPPTLVDLLRRAAASDTSGIRVLDRKGEQAAWLSWAGVWHRALRVAGDVPGAVTPNERIRRQGARQQRAEEQLRFLHFHMEQSLRHFEKYIGAAEDAEQRRLWQDLAERSRGVFAELTALGL